MDFGECGNLGAVSNIAGMLPLKDYQRGRLAGQYGSGGGWQACCIV